MCDSLTVIKDMLVKKDQICSWEIRMKQRMSFKHEGVVMLKCDTEAFA